MCYIGCDKNFLLFELLSSGFRLLREKFLATYSRPLWRNCAHKSWHEFLIQTKMDPGIKPLKFSPWMSQ